MYKEKKTELDLEIECGKHTNNTNNSCELPQTLKDWEGNLVWQGIFHPTLE